ncbi:MAG: DUF1287 domain-containing protein, partial [Candidatus Electrothrix sp. AX5]|nr:DUF1287 domain-containing protein [Candidatus Electrothrix sp. AX5]
MIECSDRIKTSLFFNIIIFFLSFPALGQGNVEISTGLAQAAIERTTHQVTYNGSYRKIVYPGGDVPDNMGVCTDVVIRSYRKIGIDLQKEVHEDMRNNFS